MLDARPSRWLQRFVVPLRALQTAREAQIADRAAAVTLFCMLAAVPSLLVLLSVLGFVLGTVDQATGQVGLDLHVRARVLEQLQVWLGRALPGVTWNPAEFASALVEHRGQNGLMGTAAAVFLGLTVFSQLDRNVRAVFGLPPRSTWRAAGYVSLLSVLAAFASLTLAMLTPLLEWGLHVADRAVGVLSFGWLELAVPVAEVAQILPIAGVFALQVRWSAGKQAKQRLWVAALAFGVLWFLGQRLFSVYVQSVVQMDAVYGALTGVLALMLWLYYANLAFLFAVALLAAWQERRRPPRAVESVPEPGPETGA